MSTKKIYSDSGDAPATKERPKRRPKTVAAKQAMQAAPAARPRATKRKSPAKRSRLRPPDPRGDFARAMTVWLDNMKYQIGLSAKDFNAEKEVAWAKSLAHVAAALVSTSMPLFISGGASSQETFPVLVPFVPLADLVAFQVKLGTPTLLLVIFADDLPCPEVHRRIEQFLQLAKPLPKFGLRLNGNATGPALICPLLVYFNETLHAKAVSELLADGYVTKVWDHLNLSTGFVNVPGQKVTWSTPHGIIGGIRSLIENVVHLKYNPGSGQRVTSRRIEWQAGIVQVLLLRGLSRLKLGGASRLVILHSHSHLHRKVQFI
jgi:hypothetical protein